MGRDPNCQVVIDPIRYRLVSRRHAEITPLLGFTDSNGHHFWQVCDLNSANGTFLNGTRVEGCQVLHLGDRLSLGPEGPEFIFDLQPLPQPPVLESTLRDSATVRPNPSRKAASGTSEPALPQVFAAPAQAKTSRPGPVGMASRSKSPRRSSHTPTDSVSLTQLFPIFSTGRDLTRKAYLLPGGLTVTFVVLMFLAVGQPLVFNLLLAAYLSGAAYYFIYQLCGKYKPWWVLVGAAIVTILLLTTPALNLFIFLFRQVLPGNLASTSEPLPIMVVKMFFGAGLMEELLKAVPLLLAYWLGRHLRPPLRAEVGIWEPLDGILLGAASAVGFTLVETLSQYLPDIYHARLAAGEGAAQLASLQLLIPRVLGSVAGHMAYSGYLGYFIGLSILRPRKRWVILGVGYLTASALHTLWNLSGLLSPVLLAAVGVVSYAFLGAAILKARELSPTRSQNFATRFYR